MLMAEFPSRPGPERARELVESISKEHGMVSEQRWASFTPEARQEIKDAFKQRDRLIVNSVSTYEHLSSLMSRVTPCDATRAIANSLHRFSFSFL